MAATEESGFDSVEALVDIGPGDTTGTRTLQRYIYQCKVAVQRWLRTLARTTECHIVCEFIDDITTVTESNITFAQVKTRDRGAWTASKVFRNGGGMDALIRSYNLAKSAEHCENVRLELILEGIAGSDGKTRMLFDNPVGATDDQRRKLVELGLQPADADEFLARLTITPNYFSRHSIDAVTLQMLATIAPGHSAIIEATYAALLDRAIAAHLGLANQANRDSPLVLQPRMESDEPSIFKEHALARSELLTLLPPTPNLAAEQRALLEKTTDGSLTMTNLEFKLRVAGANDRTVDRAKSRRATASAILASRASLSDEADHVVARLGGRLLEYAEGVTADILAAALPAARNQPADAIFGRLIQHTSALGQLDSDDVLDGDGNNVLGYLCELSDQCQFSWRNF